MSTRCTPSSGAHYLERLVGRDSGDVSALHRAICAYYTALVDELPELPALEDFAPLVEAVHHAAAAGDYDDAYELFWRGAPMGEHLLTQRLGAYQVQLAVMREFFPEQDVKREPLVTNPDAARFILHEVGFCLKALGRLTEAEPFFERAYYLAIQLGDPINASIIRVNHASLCEDLGELARGVQLAQEAVDLAKRARLLPLRYNPQDTRWYERGALLKLARLAELTGSAMSSRLYLQAVAVSFGRMPYEDACYVDFLRRIGQISMAREAVASRKRELEQYLDEQSMTERLIGDLEAGAKRLNRARSHYDQAVSCAQRIDRRDVLLEALIARGRFAAQQGEFDLARSDLGWALKEATGCAFRLHEVDVRLALATTYRAAGDLEAAHREAEQARQMGAFMDYYWGEAAAADLLREMADPDGRSRSADRTRMFQELQRELEETKTGQEQAASGRTEPLSTVLTPFFEHPDRVQQALRAGALTYEAEFLRRRPDYGAVVRRMLTEFRRARDADPDRCFAFWGAWMEPVDAAIRMMASLATEGGSRTIVDDPVWAVRSMAQIIDISLQPFARLRLEMRGLAGMGNELVNAAGAASLSFEEVVSELGADAEGEALYRPAVLLEWLGARAELPRTGSCVLVGSTVRCSRNGARAEAPYWSVTITDLFGLGGFVHDLWYAHKVAYEIFSVDNLEALEIHAPHLQITEYTADATLAYSLITAGFRIQKAQRTGMKWEFMLDDRHARAERAVKTALEEASVPYVTLTGPVEVKARVRSGRSSFEIGFRTRLRTREPDAVSELFDTTTHLNT